LNGTKLGHAAEIVSFQIDDHEELGAVFFGGAERGFVLTVSIGIDATRTRAFDRPRL
jgi:hypothetical protein